MKMVAAAKLRRAQDAILKTRPYAQLLDRSLSRVAARAAADGAPSHPLLEPREAKTAEVIVVTSDRGLAGGFNSNISRRVQRFLTEEGERFKSITLATIGKKGRDFFRARKLEIRKDFTGVHAGLTYEKADAIAKEFTERYLAGEVDTVYLAYNEFKSAIVQKPVVVQLLPIDTGDATAGGDAAGASIDFKYEPSREALLAALLPRHISMQVWRALLESAASEHGARMSAMESATKNAEEMIAALTLQYNRARQAYVTKELSEIVSGAEAL
jgi:F-type H+-transporting ATPase subunit gamma